MTREGNLARSTLPCCHVLQIVYNIALPVEQQLAFPYLPGFAPLRLTWKCELAGIRWR
jgi:hypothetical protein